MGRRCLEHTGACITAALGQHSRVHAVSSLESRPAEARPGSQVFSRSQDACLQVLGVVHGQHQCAVPDRRGRSSGRGRGPEQRVIQPAWAVVCQITGQLVSASNNPGGRTAQKAARGSGCSRKEHACYTLQLGSGCSRIHAVHQTQPLLFRSMAERGLRHSLCQSGTVPAARSVPKQHGRRCSAQNFRLVTAAAARLGPQAAATNNGSKAGTTSGTQSSRLAITHQGPRQPPPRAPQRPPPPAAPPRSCRPGWCAGGPCARCASPAGCAGRACAGAARLGGPHAAELLCQAP